MEACRNCKKAFDLEKRIPMNLRCSHAICKQCLGAFTNNNKNKCPSCGQEVLNVERIKPHQTLLAALQRNNQSNGNGDSNSDDNSDDDDGEEEEQGEESSHTNSIQDNSNTNTDNKTYSDIVSGSPHNSNRNDQSEPCLKHPQRFIDFFCQTCTTTVCSICIFETHNGHLLTLLEDMSTIIKNNVKDFGKILKHLEKVNEDNQSSVETKLEEVQKQKEYQRSLVIKSFEEIKKKIESKQEEILKEFDEKYTHEDKRFIKIQNCLKGDYQQMNRIEFINGELTKNFETFSDAKILKKIDEFTSFLHRSAADIKRLYKTEISLKAELVIDPAMKPIPISITNLIDLLEKIDAKSICYPLDDLISSSNDSNDNDGDLTHKNNHDINRKAAKGIAESSYYHHQQIEKKSIENEIEGYLKRIGTIETEKTDSDNNFTDGNLPRSQHKIPRQRKIFLQQIRNNQVDHMNNSLQMQRDKRKRETAALRNNNTNDHYDHNAHSSQYHQPYPQMNINPNNIKPWRYQINTIPNKEPNPINRVPSVGHSSKRSHNSINLSLPLIASEPDIDTASVYCFGEASYCLKFLLSTQRWEVIKYSEYNKILGSFRYHSLCTLPGQRIVLTGGVKTIDDEASNIAIEINTKNINQIKALKPMLMRRYGHGSVYHHGYIYVIGGYEHHDQKTTSILSTLKVCERYNCNSQRWETMSSMNHPRAFFGLGIFIGSIYVFGGLYNEQLLASIEKYDLLTNVWITHNIKLSQKLSKMGVIRYKKDTVILLGGLNDKYMPITDVHTAILNQSYEWTKSIDMLYPHTAGSSAFLWDDMIFILGGSIDGVCEKYDFNSRKWEIIEGYVQVIKGNKQDDLIKNFSCALNFYSGKV